MSRPLAARRRAFTLFQLLLVLALLAILFGLLLPLVQRARVSAQRIQDANNLKQLCLATINAADTNTGKLAPLAGPYPNADATANGNGYGTIFFHILPYIEQDPLYKSSSDGKT